ncbi:hypothetical protein RN001_008806 [Aquatica leii]|uniref:Uncharacterized protein n=1 Tax=Aquatica leii TaxID=1421715 RepID=A0AAN7P4R2_9COLE|nr:hypothetical protein RN001_008806 [Aquatica leii]
MLDLKSLSESNNLELRSFSQIENGANNFLLKKANDHETSIYSKGILHGESFSKGGLSDSAYSSTKAGNSNFELNSLNCGTHSREKQLLVGKQHIDSLLEKLTLLAGNSEDNAFSSRYVSGCSTNQERSDPVNVDSTSGESEPRSSFDLEAFLKPELFNRLCSPEISPPSLTDSEDITEKNSSSNSLLTQFLCYGEAHQNSRKARRIYQQRYPLRHIPSHPTFQEVDRRLRETGCFKPPKSDSGRLRRVRTPNTEDIILQAVDNDPHVPVKIFLVNALTIALAGAVSLKLEPFQLDEFLHGTFGDRGWNGSWISDTTVLYEDASRNIYLFDVNQHTSKLFLNRSVFNDYAGSSISFYDNLRYALLKYNTTFFYDVHGKKHLQLVQWAPKNGALAYVYENNIYYVSNVNKITTPRQITNNGVSGIIYNGIPDWVYEEVLGSGSALWFSPDGSHLAFAQFNDTKVKDFHYFIYGQSYDQYPTVVTLKYPKVNTTNPLVEVKYVNLNNPKSTVVNLKKAIPTRIVSEDYIIQDIKWAKSTDIIYTYKATKGWIDLKSPIFNSDGSKYLMITSENQENDSYKHLSLLENNDFAKRKRLTFGKRVVDLVYGWDEIRNLVYYVGSVEGHHGQQQVYVVDLNTTTDRCLTCDFNTLEGPCMVSSASFSKKFSYYTRICNGPGPKTVQIYNLKTLTFYEWENNANLRMSLSKKLRPIRKSLQVPLSSGFVAHARLLLPPDLDENAGVKYPMIVNINCYNYRYGGPNANQISDGYSAGEENYFVTNRKYIYAFIDARGSGKLGDNNMFQMYKKLGTVEIADQIEVTRYSIYTERFMGLNTKEDNMEGYHNTDVSQFVEEFRNKTLYLIHGNADDNVHYQQSMLLSKALQGADIMFFQQSYPDNNHGLGSVQPHLYHTIDKFFNHGIKSLRKGKIWKLKKNRKQA